MVQWGKSHSLSLVIVLAGCTLNPLEYSILALKHGMLRSISREDAMFMYMLSWEKEKKRSYEVPTLSSRSGESSVVLFPKE